jgi:hypothetical protein
MAAVRTRAVVVLLVLGVLSGAGLAVAAGVTLSAFLRYLGMALQVAGFGIVARGLIDRRERFTDRPSLLTRAGRHLRRTGRLAANRLRRLLGRPVTQTVRTTGVASDLTITFNVNAEVRYGSIDDRLPVSERLAQLDARTREIQERVNRLQSGLGSETTAREAAGAEERAARQAAVEHLDKKLTDLAAGGLHVEWWGVAAFILGTVLGAIPAELAELFT